MVQKNFKITNGLEVNTNLIFADTNSNKVGIATTVVNYTLDVNGNIGAKNSVITGVSTTQDLVVDGKLSVGSTSGIDGAYLVSTGTGVTWSVLPGLRYTQTYTATASQDTFNFSYNPAAGVDVYVNGVRLSSAEYIATNGISIVLNDASYEGDTIDLVAYSVTGLGAGVTGITGLTVLDEGISVGNDGNIVSLNFVGATVTSSVSGFGVTVTLSDYVSSSGISSYSNIAGISSYSDVAGISTDVIGGIASVTSVIAGIVTATDGFISVGNTTPIQISLIGDQLTFTAVGIGSTTLTLF
jgi:hypothetical protein